MNLRSGFLYAKIEGMSYEFPKKYYKVKCKKCGFVEVESQYDIEMSPPSSCNHCGDPNCNWIVVSEISESQFKNFTTYTPFVRFLGNVCIWVIVIVIVLFFAL